MTVRQYFAALQGKRVVVLGLGVSNLPLMQLLLDYGCICVHVFSAEARTFYDLERLWADGKPLDLSGVLTQN